MKRTILDLIDAVTAAQFINSLNSRFIRKIMLFFGFEKPQGLTGSLDAVCEFEWTDYQNQDVSSDQLLTVRFYDVKDLSVSLQSIPENIWCLYEVEFRFTKETRFDFVLRKPIFSKWQPSEHTLFSFHKAEMN